MITDIMYMLLLNTMQKQTLYVILNVERTRYGFIL